MWSAMMVGMMLPSAVPAVVRYGRTMRRAPAAVVAPLHFFVAGYTVPWLLFSLAATLLQRLLYEARLLSPMMEPASAAFASGLLLAAGVYQLLPFKRTCLESCRSVVPPGHPEGRTAGEAFTAGVHCGRACLASNWLLMLLLFAGGVMNLVVIVALTGIVLLEKVAPVGIRSTWVTGVLLFGLSLWTVGR
jgi:predicted metal-binding membrane protein